MFLKILMIILLLSAIVVYVFGNPTFAINYVLFVQIIVLLYTILRK